MIWEDLNENLIVPDLEAKSSDEVFEKLHLISSRIN